MRVGEQHAASLLELFRFFFFVGVTAFGGPIAHYAVLEREAVRERQWLTHEEFLDMMGLLNIIPGPNSTQMVMYLGYRQRGILGMLAAGCGFIIPAFTITVLVTWLFVFYGTLPQGQAILFGIQPVVVGVIASALWRFVPQGITSWRTAVIFGFAFISAVLGGNETLIILSAGVLGLISSLGWQSSSFKFFSLLPIAPSLGKIFQVYTKMALTLYGTGYLLAAYMKSDLVDALGWLTNQQLLDAIAIGQMTPGPFLTVASSTGMFIRGFQGAVVATAAIFLPSFFLIGFLGNRVCLIRGTQWGKAVLSGINAAVVAVLLVVTVSFSLEVADHWVRLVFVVLTLIALERYKINSMLLILLGGLMGLVCHYLLLSV